MKVTQLRIDGIENPMGFQLKQMKCSWKVEDAKSRYQTYARIVVSTDELFQEIVYKKEGKKLKSIGERLELELKPYTRYYYYVEVYGENAECAQSKEAWFETGKMQEIWESDWISSHTADTFHPEFVRRFNTEKKIIQARLYICGLGLYEAYLNEKKVGEDYLAPFTSDYHKKIQYQTYDVTDFIQEKNCIRILCGNGWYKGRLGYEGHEQVYGDRFMAIAELRIRYEDNSQEIIKTDKTWQYRGSDIESSDIYDGEVLNRQLWLGKDNPYKPVEVLDIEKKKLTERDSLKIKVQETIMVEKVILTPAGETVLDFGQNCAGYVEFDAAFSAGSRIVLDYGEILQDGNFYNENYRSAKARFVYVSDGRTETVRPHFTFFGFRYVRVSGCKGMGVRNLFRAKVLYSDLKITGNIVTSNDQLNRLFLNCMWGQKSNFVDMPTDCPQRDERLGWTGDAQVFAPTASFNMDTRAFYSKFLDDLRIEQLKWGGSIPNYIPNYSNNSGGASVWGDAATFLPMTLYEYFGDKDRLEYDYPMMRDWVDYLTRETEKHGTHYLLDFGMQFGDWLAMDGVTEQSFKGGTDEHFIASVYYYASTKKLARAAEILDKLNDYKKYTILAEQIRQAVLNEYFSSTGRLCIDTQAAYLISLRFQIYRTKARITEGLKKRLQKDCYRIKCGFVGAPIMCQVLSENGMEDIAYRILFYEGFPGWLHCVNLGATTIWERWNSVLDDGHISGTNMNSLNHYAYGSVVEYLYRQIAGLNPLEAGFTRVLIEPKVNSRLREMNCCYNSASGKYMIHWKLLDTGRIQIHVEIPFNCKAKLKLPGYEEGILELEAGITELDYLPTVDYTRPFSNSSTLEELAECEEAVAILKQYAPAAVGMIEGKDCESLALSIEDLLEMPYMGFDPENIRKTIEKVKMIQVC